MIPYFYEKIQGTTNRKTCALCTHIHLFAEFLGYYSLISINFSSSSLIVKSLIFNNKSYLFFCEF